MPSTSPAAVAFRSSSRCSCCAAPAGPAQRRAPTRYSTNIWRASSRRDTTSFLLPRGTWRRPSFRRMARGRWVAPGLQHSGRGLRGGGRRQRWSSAVAAADCRTLRSLLRPRGEGRDEKGDSFRECNAQCIAMPCTYLVMNESSWAWIGAERAGWQESRLRIQNVLYNSIFTL